MSTFIYCAFLFLAKALDNALSTTKTIDDWPVEEKKIRNVIGFEEPLMYGFLELVFAKLRTSLLWEITPNFIAELGQTSLELISMRALTMNVKKISKV